MVRDHAVFFLFSPGALSRVSSGLEKPALDHGVFSGNLAVLKEYHRDQCSGLGVFETVRLIFVSARCKNSPHAKVARSIKVQIHDFKFFTQVFYFLHEYSNTVSGATTDSWEETSVTIRQNLLYLSFKRIKRQTTVRPSLDEC